MLRRLEIIDISTKSCFQTIMFFGYLFKQCKYINTNETFCKSNLVWSSWYFLQFFYFYYLLFNFKKNLTSSNKKNSSFLSNAKVTTVSGQETHHDHTTLTFLMYTIRKKIVKQVLSLVLNIVTILLWMHLQKHIHLFLTSDNRC